MCFSFLKGGKMRKVYRNSDTLSYWDKRWGDFDRDDDIFHNMEIYPIKYTNKVVDTNNVSLDAGCGLGRVVKHYQKKGYKIAGCDYSRVAVEKLQKSDPELDVRFGDIRSMPYENEQFNNIFALGVFHSIENLDDIKKGVKESFRCLKPGGYLIAAVRADSLENYLIDFITRVRGAKGTKFHKWCFKEKEILSILTEESFVPKDCELVTNVSFLHKISLFRKSKIFDEKLTRSYGFKLNHLGDFVYKMLKKIAPKSFGTTIVVTAQKPI